MNFISERNREMHGEYFNALKLKYRIFEKSYQELCGADLKGVLRARIPLGERENAAKLYSEILAHKIFFESFGERNTKSERIKREYGSVSSFLFEIFSKAKDSDCGFLFIYEDGGGIAYSFESDLVGFFRKRMPTLALDLFEHSYFYDYGFKKEDYIMNAISYLDLTKLDNNEKSHF